jgi:hypothetical protein
VARGGADEAGDPSRFDEIVRLAEADQVAGGRGDADVAGMARALSIGRLHEAEVRAIGDEAPNEIGGAVGRCVVDDGDVERHRALLLRQRVQLRVEGVDRVVHRDDHADERGNRSRSRGVRGSAHLSMVGCPA